MKVRFYFQEIVSAEISRWDEHSVRYLFCQLLCLLFLFQQIEYYCPEGQNKYRTKPLSIFEILIDVIVFETLIWYLTVFICAKYVFIFICSIIVLEFMWWLNVSKEMVWSSRPEITFSRLFKGWYGSLWILKPNT